MLSFIYLFVFSSLMPSFVHTECMCLRKKNITCRSSGRQNGLTCFYLSFFFFFFFFFFYCKDPAQTVRMHMHMIWNFGGHIFSWTPSLISCKSFFYCKDPKTLIRLHRCTCMNMLILNFAGQMFPGHHFMFHYFFFFFFFFFFWKSPDQPIFHLRLSVAKTHIKLCGCSLYWAIKHLWYPIPLTIINKQINLE